MITEYALDTVLTIAFLNKAINDKTPRVWVCEDRATFDRELESLRGMAHIEVVQSGPSLIKRSPV
jgi:hypothetical protein